MSRFPARHGCALRWAATRVRCPECGGLVDWRSGREGRVWMRRHYRYDRAGFEWCVEVHVTEQRDLTGYGVELPAMIQGCQSLARVSQLVKRRRGL